MEKYVIDLEHAKRLKELGVDRDSEFYWDNTFYGCPAIEGHFEFCRKEDHDINTIKNIESYKAYLTDELLKMLPYNVTIFKTEDYYGVDYKYSCDEISKYDCNGHIETDKNIYNALAKMLIFLLENKIIKVEDINKRKV